ncbi:putative G3BP-like protein [Erysiphe necator]|uniref:Putative ntf2 and rrm domain-containing protein n=1 Tax=Uncinula necator TaxID=52586 RepID=A0A0B1PCB7_UNCNE|nr:putative G3BP-like protein [Erysiphe necator]KHJ35898.1 putative ntf2 and rrm domain-containing protein [Erysiphe necator]
MTTNGSYPKQDQSKTESDQFPANSVTESTPGNPPRHNHTKDEVGWCFVEQFYTTLGERPEQLHLFYGKNSQFVYGPEAESSPVSVGRDAIQERFKELNFQEAKVRLSNVDSQASYDSIVVQVIGEISHLSAEPKKFVQSFVLAQQSNGYFVLNDIFRLINDDLEEGNTESNHEENIPASSLEAKPENQKEEAIPMKHSPVPLKTKTIDENVEEPVGIEEPPSQEPKIINGGSFSELSVAVVSEAEVTKPIEEELRPEVIQKTTEEIKEAEKPQESSPTLTAARHQNSGKTQTSTQSTVPPQTLSWANRVAATPVSNPKPAVPAVPSKNSITSKNRTSSSTTKSTQATTTAPKIQPEKEKENAPIGSGWQTAGDNQKKQNRPQSISAPPEKEGTLGYIRNVTEKVDAEELRSVLSTFGNLTYFDVNRFKNCAFVEFASAEGYQAANNASPHLVSGEPIYVEPRRHKAGYGGNGYYGRGGANQRGRSGYSNRSRGSGASPRGRDQSNNVY